MAFAGGRPNASFSRLKQISIDPLEELGLPSKGDDRLLDLVTQEKYFDKVKDRFRVYQANKIHHYDLDNAFASLSVNRTIQTASPTIVGPFDVPSPKRRDSVEVSIIMSAMRKLREGIIASSRRDVFAKRAYVFMVRVAILISSVEAYHPALLHLLGKIHPATPLSALEFHMFVGYYILHLASQEDDMIAAYSARRTYKYKDAQIDQILRAIVSGNWYRYWKVSIAMDVYQRSLLQMADKRMRIHALKCIAKSYLDVDIRYVESATESDWKSLKNMGLVSWELEGEKLIIKRPKK